MIAIFVTNEDSGRREFDRYKKGFKDRNWHSCGTRVDCLSYAGISDVKILVVKGDKNSFKEKSLLSDKNLIEYQTTDSTAEKAAKTHITKFTGFLAKSYRDSFALEKDKRIADKVHCFIHWGGGDEATIPRHEKMFQQRYDDLVAQLPTNPFSSIRFHSVSTIRPHLFDVGGNVIYVPESRMAFDSLVERFEDGQKYAGIKDILTRFVVLGDLDNKRNLVCDFFARENVRSDLHAFMGDPQAEWLKSWGAFRTYLNTPNAKLNIAVDAMLQNPSETKKLASQLLSIPQLLKEWIML